MSPQMIQKLPAITLLEGMFSVLVEKRLPPARALNTAPPVCSART